jgi:two-component system sensor histidine kinase/response regulator
MLRDRPIKQKLMTVVLMTSGAVLLLTCGAFLVYDLITFRQTMFQNASTLAQVIAANSTAALAFDSREDATKVLSAFAAEPHIVAAGLYDQSGTLFAKYPDRVADNVLPSRPEHDGYQFERGYFVLNEPVVNAGRRLGTVHLKSDLGALSQRLVLYGGLVIGVLIFSFLVAFGLSSRLQSHISQPILALARTAKIVSERKDYSVRAVKLGNDELGGLTDAFNGMLAQIQQQDSVLRAREEHLRLEVAERTRAEEEVRTLNADLEGRVRERTRALEEAHKEAEDATKAKGEFLANMSHEIRTPMNAIIGMTELALNTKLTAEQRDYLRTVKDSSEALLTLINDILDFSKIEARRLSLENVPFVLRDAVEDAFRMLASRAQEKGLELACHIAPEAPIVVAGDSGRLRQVLINLVGNAIKFTEHGEVIVDVALGNIGDDVALQFTVTDTGIGIAPDNQGRIFGAFVQADPSTTRRYGGTGLGLAIAGQLVELMGGRIWIESELGKGSRFHFVAHFGISHESAGQKAIPASADLLDLPVLIVDDNATNRRILAEMLTGWRMKPISVDTARAALVALREAAENGAPYQLVLSDALMPEMDGFALARAIKDDPRISVVKLIMLTSAGHAQARGRAQETGFDACLSKPVKQSDLLDAILTVFGPSSDAAPSTVAREPAPAHERSRPLHILVAEDNLTNQKLVVTLLEQRNHIVVVAPNGRDAVRHSAEQSFDIILMDVQMPEMSGLDATAVIRERERVTGTHVPIVAMTAHAMTGDRERCLAAGMDAYVSKPLRSNELLATIDSLVASDSYTAASAAAGAEPDVDTLLSNFDGNGKILREVIEVFLDESPNLMAVIQQAAEKRDAASVASSAHTLKGSIGLFVHDGAYEAAQRLERAAKSNDLTKANDAYAELQGKLAELLGQLRKVRQRLTS